MNTKTTRFRNIVLLMLLFLFSGMKQTYAQLATGDLLFTGYNSNDGSGGTTNKVSFVVLKSTGIPANTTFYLTDNGYSTPANGLTTTEGVVTVVTGSAVIPQFTEICIQANSAGTSITTCTQNSSGSFTSSNISATVTSNAFQLSTGGDQVFIYTGSLASPTFITGIQMNNKGTGLGGQPASTASGWDAIASPAGSGGYAMTQNLSAIPPALTNGTNAMIGVVSPGTAGFISNNGTFNCSQSVGTSLADLKSKLTNVNNWTLQVTTPVTVPTGCSYGVGAPPSITGQPSSAAICAGGSTSFSVTASNATGYQWQVNTGSGFANITNGGVYSGATTATLNITGATAGMNGYQYQCVVTGISAPNATSNSVTLTVNGAPSVTGQPAAATTCAGSNTTFSVTASNATGYQWQVNTGSGFGNITNGGVYSGATTATLTITGATAGMNGYTYQCIVSGTCTPNATSNAAALTVGSAPSVTGQPSNSTICAGNNTTFSITASNASGYQWQVNTGSGYANLGNTGVYSGATTATLTITGATVGMNGYTYQCIVNGACTPNATSNAATLAVNSAPAVTGQPTSATICVGSNTAFSIAASNATGYQWQVNTGSGFTNVSGAPYSGGATSTLTITGATAGMNGYTYQCIVSGACTPNATSNTVTLTVNTSNSWIGNVNSAWSLSANWGCGSVPTATSDVIIPSGTLFNPLINITTAACNNITINSGSTLAFSGATNVLSVNGNIVNIGTFNATSGKVKLSGSTQTVPGLAYRNLEIAGTGTKTISAAASVSGTLTLTSGYLQLGNNNLTLGTAGVISGGSSSSFIITNGTGKLVNQGIGPIGKTGAIVFPVGINSGSYTPATITNTGTTDDYSVSVFNHLYSSYNNDVPNGTAQAIDAIDRTWLVSEATVGGSNVTLTLQWNGVEELSGFDMNNCYLVHYNNTTNTYSFGTIGIAGGSDPYTQSWSGLTSFSPFGVSSIGSPLSVDLISFALTGKSQKGKTDLQWVTANERNMSSYGLERSDDGVSYVRIATLKAASQNTEQQHIYNYEDATADNAAQHYYRLRMEELDGSFTYSNIVVVSNTGNLVSYEIYPNPVSGSELFIKSGSSQPAGTQVQITDMQGKTMLQTIPENWQQGVTSVSVKQLPTGIYLLQLTNKQGELISTLRFTKK